MMDMMEPDIGGEPGEWLGKEIVGAAAQRCSLWAPAGRIDPVRVFELMLYVEQPYPDRSCDKGYRSVDRQKTAPAKPRDHQAHQQGDCDIRSHDAEPAA